MNKKLKQMNNLTNAPKMALPIALFLALGFFHLAKAQTPTVAVRLANPVYECVTDQYCLDVEFQTDLDSVEIFGMNVRFFYDDATMEFATFADFQGGYGPVSPDPPQVLQSMPGFGTTFFGFPAPGVADWVNGAIQLVDNSQPMIFIDTNAWTKLFQICFIVQGPIADSSSFCPAVVWDLELNPANGGYLTGDDGVVITVVADPPAMSGPSSENVVQYNWMYTGDGSAPPYGAPVETECISLFCIPTLVCAPDITIECNESTDTLNTGSSTVMSECIADVTISYSDFVDSQNQICDNSFVITRTWLAVNDCNFSDTCVQFITVIDTQGPIVVCPPDIIIECDESTDPSNTGQATASDLCDTMPTVTYIDITVAGDCPQEYTIDRIWTATDDCGNNNFSLCRQRITIVDTTPPTIVCPADLTLECSDEVPTDIPAATDNCGTTFTTTFSDIMCDNPIMGFTGPYDINLWDIIAPMGGEVIPMGDMQVMLEGPDGPNPCPSGASVLFQIVIPSTGQLVFDWDYTSNDVDGEFFDPFGYNLNGTFFQLTDDNGGPIQSGTASVQVTAGDVFAFEQRSIDCILGSGSTTVVEFFACVENLDPVCNSLIIRSHTVTDECGNSANCIQTIYIEDTTPPTFDPLCQLVFDFFTSDSSDCPADAAISLVNGQIVGENEGWSVGGNVIPSLDGCLFDNCTNPDSLLARVDTIVISGNDCDRTFTVSFTILDNCSNESTSQFVCVVNIHDDVAPIITCPADITIECDESTLPVDTGVATATDDCQDPVTITSSDATAPGACPQEMVITRTWVADDNCGNVSSCQQIITIEDTTPPAIFCPGDITIECSDSMDPDATGFASATDNCDTAPVVTYDDSVAPGACPQESTITRTWTATDACGNSTTCQQVIFVDDSTPPVIACPADLTLECTDPIPTDLATATDNCSTALTITYSDVQCDNPIMGFTGPYDFSFWTTIIPAEGGSVTTMSDNEVMLVSPDDITLNCDDAAVQFSIIIPSTGQVVFDWNYTTNDVDGPSFDPFGYNLNGTFFQLTNDNGADTQSGSVSIDVTAGDVFAFEQQSSDCVFGSGATTVVEFFACIEQMEETCTSLIIRTHSATDECGNESNCVQTIFIEDTTPPAITCPLDIVIECDALTLPDNTGLASATDNCDTTPEITYSDVIIGSQVCVAEYTINRTWTATDVCGNSTNCVQIITVDDSTPPVITCPDDVTLECTEDTSTESNGFASATDNCSEVITITSDDVTIEGTCPQEYTISRTWTALDECGNSSTCIQTLVIEDTTPPAIFCPGDVTIECDVDPVPDNTGGFASATDNCDTAPIVTYDDSVAPGACPQESTITRTWTATDACGNSTTCQQVIFVDDSTPPVIVCPTDLTLECTDPIPTDLATATDNCSTALTITYSDVQCDNPTMGFTGPYDFSFWTTTIPVQGGSVTTMSDTEVMLESADSLACINASVLFSIVIPSTGQVVFDWNYTTNDVDGPSFDPFGYNLNGTFFQLTNDNGADTQSGSVSIDVTAGDVFAFEQQSSDCVLGSGATTVVEFFACIEQIEETCTSLIIRTHSATDECGNESNCVQTFFIEDTTPPAITCPLDIVIECDASTLPDNTGLASATDNCDTTPEITYSDVTIGSQVCVAEYTINRTWTATDACGNSTNCVQIITVDDSTPPVITCPDDVTLECTEDTSTESNGFASATDNCSEVITITSDDITIEGACPQEYTISRTWTALDECGNSSTCIQTLVIEDTTPPAIFCPGDITIECTDSTDPDDIGFASATDNCDTAPVVTYDDSVAPGACPQESTITRTWTATDACGNSTTCQQVIFVDDSTPPTIVCPTDLTLECTDPIPTDLATATDNCSETVTITYNDVQCDNPTMGFTGPYDFSFWTTIIPIEGGSVTTMSDNEVMLVSPDDVTFCDEAAVQFSIIIPSTGQVVFDWNYTTNDVDGPFFDPFGYNLNGTFFQLTDDNGADIQSGSVSVDVTAGDVFAFEQQSADCVFGAGATTVVEFFACIEQMEETCTSLIIRTHSATDECGNESNCVQTIFIEDTTPPSLTCPLDIVIECDASTLPDNTGLASATDNCDTTPEITYNDAISGSQVCIAEYTITRTWTATDICGNSTNCVQIITVDDSTPPVITCPDDITVECDEVGSDQVCTISQLQSGAFANLSTITGCGSSFTSCAEGVITSITIQLQDVLVSDFRLRLSTGPNTLIPEYTQEFTVAGNGDITIPLITPFPLNDGQVASFTVIPLTGVGVVANLMGANGDPYPGGNYICETNGVLTNFGADIYFVLNIEETANTGFPTVSDNCDIAPDITYNDEIVDGECPQEYTITRTWTALDECGNISTCVQTIVVDDSTPPVVTCPDDITIDCNDSTDPESTGFASATDNCDFGGEVGLIVDYSDITIEDGCPEIIERTWTSTDACGNVGSCVQTITIDDTNAPAILCPEDVTVECASDVPAILTGGVTVSDNCGFVTVTHEDDVVTDSLCVNQYTISRIYLATDECGNTATCAQNIVVFDDTPPTLTCPAGVTVSCASLVPAPAPGSISASDNCAGVVTVTHTGDVITNQTCVDRFAIIRTYQATDVCGNTATCTQVITVFDNTPPSITCPANLTVSCASQVPTVNTGSVTTSDNCGGTVTVTHVGDVITNQTCANRFTLTRTYRATDACGNSATCAQIITVFDNTPPVIACPPNITVTFGNSTAPVATGNPTGSDNCGGVPTFTFVDATIAGPCPEEFTINRTWTATDACGLTATCLQVIFVDGDCILDLALTKELISPAEVDGGDNVVFEITITNEGEVTVGAVVITDYIPLGFTLNDNDWTPGNAGSTGQSASITLSVANGGLDANGLNPGEFVTVQITLQANIDIEPSCYMNFAEISFIFDMNGIDISDDEIDSDPDQIDTNDPDGEDDIDDAVICVQPELVIVGDGYVCPGEIVTYCVTNYNPDFEYEWVINNGGTITGTTGECITVEWQDEPGGPFEISVNAIACAGCNTFAFLNVYIQGVETLACNDLIQVSLGEDCTSQILSGMILEGEAEGNNNYYVIITDANGNVIPDATLTSEHIGLCFTVTVVNECNDQSCWGTICVEDKIPPVIECTDVTVSCGTSLEPVFAPPVTGTAVESLDSGLPIGPNGGTVTTQEFILDVPANAVITDVDITIDLDHSWVGDLTVELVSPAGTSVLLFDQLCGAVDNWENVTFDDEAGISVTAACNPIPPALDGSVIPQEALAAFIAQSAVGTWSLVITDQVGGDGGTLNIVSLEVDYYLAVPNAPIASDACGEVELTYTDSESGDACEELVITRTWTATDGSGNTATCVQLITITPLTLDNVDFPPAYEGVCGESILPQFTGWPTVDGTPITDENDLCNIFVGYWDKELNECGGGRKIVRTWTVLDWCEVELVEAVQVIKLTDNIGPELTCPEDFEVGTDFWYCYANVSVPKPIAFDECSEIASYSLSSSSGIIVSFGNNFVINGLLIGTHTVTWTVTDECGNSSTCSFEITVVDDVVPVALCDEHTIVSLTNDGPSGVTLVPASVFDDGSYDNCGPVTFRARRMDSCIDFDWTTEGACIDDVPGGIPPVNSRDRGTVHRPCVPFACCDVGAGPIMVELEVTDAAGNVNYCMIEATVQDKISPFVECPPDIIVSCDFWFNVQEGTFEDGAGNNDGSLDEDPLSAVFGNMYDAFRYDESIRSHIIINDPSNDDYPQPYNWGLDGWADDNCEVNLQVRVRVIDDCSGDDLPGGAPDGAVKLIERRFSASDGNEGIAPGTCTQRIWVVDFDPFYITDNTCNNSNSQDGVIWPCDVLLTTCPEDLGNTGEPTIFDDACSLIGVTYEDTRFDFVDGACFKILREWAVIDWCQYDPQTGAGLWHYTQVIKVHDEEGPAFVEPCETVVLCVADEGVSLPDNNQAFLGEDNPLSSSCSVHLNLSRVVHETCSDIVEYDVKIYPFNGTEYILIKATSTATVDENNDAVLTFDTRQSTIQAIRLNGLPYNSQFCGDYHRILWSVEDGCGNWSHCEYLFRLEDCKQPSPVCINGLSTVVMPIGGQVTVWAKDFNASSFDDCTPADELLYSFSGDSYTPSFTYNCDNVPAFNVELSEEIWVADGGTDDNCNGIIEWSERNKDFCTTTIVITDNNNVCGGSGAILAGDILTEQTDAVAQVNVTLTSPGHFFPQYITTQDGHFAFLSVPLGDDYMITPERNDAHRNGVSTLDLVRIQKHLLGKELFTSPYQYIAADANNTKTISAIDLVEIRKLILGIYSEFPANKSWRFVDKGFPMDEENPWPFNENIELFQLADDSVMHNDFVGVKIGDVNNSAQANSTQVLPRNGRRVLNVAIDATAEVQAGEMINVSLSIPETVEGFQWTLETEGLSYEGISSETMNISDTHVGVLNDGVVTMSWNKDGEDNAGNQQVMHLQFVALASGNISNMIRLTSKVTEAEAYTAEGEILDVRLTREGEAAEFALYQNNPNPWNAQTTIGFDLPADDAVTFTVFEATGKVVKTITGDYKAGYNTITIDARELPATGVMYYRLESGEYSASKKMVLIK